MKEVGRGGGKGAGGEGILSGVLFSVLIGRGEKGRGVCL